MPRSLLDQDYRPMPDLAMTNPDALDFLHPRSVKSVVPTVEGGRQA